MTLDFFLFCFEKVIFYNRLELLVPYKQQQ